MLTREGSPADLGVEERLRPPTKLAVLISNKGSGSNLGAIIAAQQQGLLHTEIGLVLSDKPDAQGLQRAIDNDILWEVRPFNKSQGRELYGSQLAQRLNSEGIEIAVMAGFMTILPPSYFQEFSGVTINVHPGLLPNDDGTAYKFEDGTSASWNKGLMTEDAVRNFLDLKFAGSTVHVATVEADSGPALVRAIIPVEKDDDVDALYGRLKLMEHKALVEALSDPQFIFARAGK